MTPTEVTFDTNMWIRLVNESMRNGHKDAAHILRVRKCIESGAIQPYFCDATIFESVDRKFRKDFLHEYADPDIQMESFQKTGETAEGIVLGTSTWVMQNKPDRAVNDLWKKDIQDALDLGFLFIRSLVPKFGSMVAELKLSEPLYKSITGEQFEIIRSRSEHIQQELDKQGVGMGYVRQLVANTLDIPVNKVNLVELTVESKNKVIGAVSEWVDGLVVCTHYAYQHKYLCSVDGGGGLGVKSVMHPIHRPWLTALGIEVLSAEELANKLNC